jgi:DNA polymerase-1
MARAEAVGFGFDRPAAERLFAQLSAERAEIEREIRDTEPLVPTRDGPPFTPKRDDKRRGYVAGAPVQKLKWVTFNPSSRQQIAYTLKHRYGWEPTEFTDSGQPEINDETLAGLKFPLAQRLQRYLMLDKRCGQIGEGKEAWLKVERNGRIHGEVVTNGAVTGRATHKHPNIAQVPKVKKPFGAECRALFGPNGRNGKKQVGADQAGVELRCLAHYMAPFDQGAYGVTVVEGTQEKGDDVHSVNARALGLDPLKTYTLSGKTSGGRDFSKTFIYAYLYGAGDEKLGTIVGKGRKRGAELRANFLAGLPALDALSKKVKRLAKRDGYLPGLDGRRLHIRSDHAALNTLLQSAGALLAKMSLVIMDEEIEKRGWRGRVELVAWIHDEVQFEADAELADEVGQMAVAAFREAGVRFNFRVPIDGEHKIGNNWRDCH